MFAELFATQQGVACNSIADNLLTEKFREAMAVVNVTVGASTGT